MNSQFFIRVDSTLGWVLIERNSFLVERTLGNAPSLEELLRNAVMNSVCGMGRGIQFSVELIPW